MICMQTVLFTDLYVSHFTLLSRQRDVGLLTLNPPTRGMHDRPPRSSCIEALLRLDALRFAGTITFKAKKVKTVDMTVDYG